MDYIKQYADFLEKYLSLEVSVKVVFDCSNGATGRVLKEIVKRNNGLDVRFINDEEDGTFPAHNPSPLAQGAMDDLARATPEECADVGAIFDPDGDRVFFVDEKGERFNSRDILSFLMPHFKQPYVVDTALGRKTLEWIMPDAEVIEAKTGHYFIKKLMREKNVELGVEHSGHYYFEDFYFADSGILAALIVISEVSKLKNGGSTLSEWKKSIPGYYQTGELNFEISDKEGAMRSVRKHFEKGGVTIKEIDGVTLEGQDFWANIRASNTEPLLRANIAAVSEGVLEERKAEILGLLQ